jgi:hypothetical protein
MFGWDVSALLMEVGAKVEGEAWARIDEID